jgi:hypothetical protein
MSISCSEEEEVDKEHKKKGRKKGRISKSQKKELVERILNKLSDISILDHESKSSLKYLEILPRRARRRMVMREVKVQILQKLGLILRNKSLGKRILEAATKIKQSL